MNKSFLKIVVIFSLILISLSSCKAKKNEIILDTKDTLSLAPNISWAVVVEPYAAFRKEASWSSNVMDHCRFGDVLMIEGNAILPSVVNPKEKEIWYRFEQGWLSETSVSVYQNKLKAVRASESMTK